MNPYIQTLMGALGSMFFAVLFRVRGRLLFFTFLGGLLSWGSYCLAGLFFDHDALRYLAATTILTLYAEIMARRLHCPSTILLVTGWIPLIPGGSLYYSISELVTGNPEGFFHQSIQTMLLMIAMSAGVLLAMTIIHIFYPLRTKNRGMKSESPAEIPPCNN